MPDENAGLKSLRTLDPQALSSVHRKFHPQILRYALYRVGDRMLAEDLTSETFIHLIDALQGGKGPSRNVSGWLFGTVNHLVNDHFRITYRRNTEPISEEFIIDPAPNIDARLDSNERLVKALGTLTEDQQLVISLRFGADMSLDETAEVMGKKANAIKALQFRAVAALRQRLENPSNG